LHDGIGRHIDAMALIWVGSIPSSNRTVSALSV